MSTKEKLFVTAEQALSMLPDGDVIHTFRSTNYTLVGADWSREEIVAAIQKYECELGGDMCRSMKHGLAVHTAKLPLFVQVRDDFDYSTIEGNQ